MQVHPSLRCNLRCHHCYSVSGPEERSALPLNALAAALDDFSAEGYNAIGVSGGEPLLYDGLTELLRAAKANSMVTTVTTNGMLLNGPRLDVLAELVDLFAVSVDGSEATHNRIRGSRHAFEGMVRGLRALRDAEVPFGLIFTLTMTNLDELAEVADLAVAEGAVSVQVHPLEEVGRADADLTGHAPDDRELAYAFIEAARLQSLHGDRLLVLLDVASRKVLSEDPGRAFALPDPAGAGDLPLAHLVAPVVVEADGTVVPIQYGFARAFAIGNIVDGFRSGAERWRNSGYLAFLALCRDVHAREVVEGRLPYFNWYGAITTASCAQPTGVTSF